MYISMCIQPWLMSNTVYILIYRYILHAYLEYLILRASHLPYTLYTLIHTIYTNPYTLTHSLILLYTLYYTHILIGVVEKQSLILNRNAQWKKKQRISILPKYLCIHFMRFFWKPTPESRDHTGLKCKILRAVTFPDVS